MTKLILLRHGQSAWNQKNLFTGWVDIPLSKKGIEETIHAGKKMASLPIDIIFSSTLIRGLQTAMIAMAYHKSNKTPVLLHEKGRLQAWATIYSQKTLHEMIPVFASDALNERMYGKLQGLNKDELRKEFGIEQVEKWRRSYKTAPPEGESLQMTAKRTLPYFEKEILPCLKRGQNVLVSAHGNSLRSIIMELDDLNEEEVVHLEIATGEPIIYEYAKKGKWDRISA